MDLHVENCQCESSWTISVDSTDHYQVTRGDVTLRVEVGTREAAEEMAWAERVAALLNTRVGQETKRIVDSGKWSVAPGSLIAEGEALAAKATPGEWRCHAGCDDDGSWAMIGPEHDPNYDADTDEEPSEVAEAKAEADAAFVMWLVERWPALLATAREVEGLRATCDSMMDSAIASANQLTEARAQVESLLSRVEDVTGATDALTYEAACVALDGMVDARRERDEARAEIARLKANYLDLADAVCRESLSVEDACRQARETREQVRGLIEDNNTLTLQRDEARAEVEREILAIVRAKEAEYAKHQCFIHEDGDGPPLCDGCGMENAAWEIADAIERWRAKP